MATLTVNAGSSSLKVSLTTARGRVLDALADADGVLDWAHARLEGEALDAVGHRVVHGGERFTTPVLLDADTIAAIAALTPLAPLHQPRSLAAIHAITAARPDLPQVACFDTAFHARLSLVARTYALPQAVRDAGVRRYGFHGLSYEHIADRLAVIDPALRAGRLIVAHLGSGASLCAMASGQSIDTTMGFSVLDGLVMGTRPGTTDPGALLYMERTLGMAPDAIEAALYDQSGLMALAGTSDMREVPAGSLARLIFAHRFGQQAAMMAASMGGMDGVVFTGGIGEHDPACRAACAAHLGWLGMALDPTANEAARGEARIGTNVWVIPADEEAVIAKHARALTQNDHASERPAPR